MEHKEISGILFAVVWAKTEKAPKRNIYQKHNKELRIRCLDPCFMHQRWLMYGNITITIIQVSQHDNYRLNHMAVSTFGNLCMFSEAGKPNMDRTVLLGKMELNNNHG